MYQLLNALCILTNIFIVRSQANNELVKNPQKMFKFQNKDLNTWHTHDVAHAQYQYVVSVILIDNNIVSRHCSGSMISPDWVLSSSHCFYDRQDRKFYLWYGNYTVSPLITNLYTKILKIYIHPSYLSTEFTRPGYFFGDNDISLLRVRKVAMPAYARLSSIDHTKMTGLHVKYIGGAAKIRREGDQFRPLRIAEGVIIKCGMTLTMWSRYVLCVAPDCMDKTHQPMHGDTGGPFIFNDKVIGVMTLGFQIPKTLISTNGLTPIKPYKEWIHQITYSTKKNNTDDLI